MFPVCRHAAAALLGAALWLPPPARATVTQIEYNDPAMLMDYLDNNPTLATNYPGYDNDTITPVYIGLRINHLFGIDSKTKSYKISGTLQTRWYDSRLDFQQYNVTGFKYLEWREKQIWTPEIYFEDAVKAGDNEEEFLRSKANGEVLYERVIHTQLLCGSMKFTSYPFDNQKCTIRLVPFRAGAKEVSLHFLHPGVTGFKGLTLGEWDNFKVSQDTGTFDLTYFDERVKWPYADIEFSMHRIVYSQFNTLICPSILLTIMSYAGYWINPAAAPGRIALAMICVLATISQKASVQARIPTVSYEVWMDTYLTINLVFNFAAVVSYAVVNFGMQRRAAEQKAEEAAKKKTDEESPPLAQPVAKLTEPGHDGGDPDEEPEQRNSLRNVGNLRNVRSRLLRFRISHLVYCDHVMRVIFPVFYIIVNIWMVARVASADD